MKTVVALAARVLVVALAVSFAAEAGEAKKNEEADPLAKFGDEKLADIGFCFQKFCEAVAAKDAKTAAAFITDMPRGLAQLDLKKDADKASFLKYVAGFEGAQLVSSHRIAIGGIGEVTYTTKAGKEQKQRMQNCGGRWKLTGL
ncbi:MAG: hypothetical protein NTW87_23740 [Planctomycetota bacterium]|nr:hypothetical protein [Planctomycetota bacterium]